MCIANSGKIQPFILNQKMYSMKFIDLATQYEKVKPQINAAIGAVFSHGQYIMGPEVALAEQALAEYIGVKHCIGNASGTTALQIALMALNIGPGDEVITTPFSFFATVEVIILLGAKPVFVDIDPKTYNMDANKLAAAITARTKVILPVNLYGQCADYDVINQIAAKHHIVVVEDAAQSFGAEYKGSRSCGLTTIGTTSFFPSKPLGCYGDGGACFTDDDHLAEVMRQILNHGQSGHYEHTRIGINGRLDTIQAAVIAVKLKELFEDELDARQQVAAWYQKYLSDVVTLPFVEAHNLSAFAQFTIAVEDRDMVRAELREKNIPIAVHYPKPLHKQPALSAEYGALHFPHAEFAASHVMSLPFHPYLKEAEVKQIADTVKSVLTACV